MAQILTASTYPLEVAMAARWSEKNSDVKGTALEDAMQKQPWDASVKGLTAVPQVLAMMNEKLDWTSQLGEAFLAQPDELQNAVQALRKQAETTGNLKSSKEQKVRRVAAPPSTGYVGPPEYIVIEPVDPEYVYVPVYDPVVVYGPGYWQPAYVPFFWHPPWWTVGPAFGFGAALFVGPALWYHYNWGHGGFAAIQTNTVLYGLIIVPGVVILGLAFALYVNKGWPLSGLARVLFFSPNVVSATVIGLVWVWMLDTQFGLINHYLGYLGIDNVPWLTSTNWSLIGVSIASVWWDLGLAFVLFLAALQDVPRDLYEAAEVDGASRWQRLWLVILPQLRPVISLVVTLQMISSLRIFSQVYVMTNGGPASSSSSVIFYMYNEAIQRQQFGYASAVAMLLFLMIIVVTILHRFVIRER